MSWSEISSANLTASASTKARSSGRSGVRNTVTASSRSRSRCGQNLEEHEVLRREDADCRTAQGAGNRPFESRHGKSDRPGFDEIQHVEPGSAAALRERDPADEQAPEAHTVERQDGLDSDLGEGLGGGGSAETHDREVRVAGLSRLAVCGKGEATIERGLNPSGGEGAKDRQGDGGRVVEIEGHRDARDPV